MKYHNKALEDSRLHIRAEIKDAKKLTAYNSLLKDLMIRVEYKKLCCRRRTSPGNQRPALCQLYQRRAVSRNLVNCCTTVGGCTTNPQQIEVMEVEHYGRLTCNKLCASSHDSSTVAGVVNKLDRRRVIKFYLLKTHHI